MAGWLLGFAYTAMQQVTSAGHQAAEFRDGRLSLEGALEYTLDDLAEEMDPAELDALYMALGKKIADRQ